MPQGDSAGSELLIPDAVPHSNASPAIAVQQNQSIQTIFTVGPGNKIESRVIKTGARIGDSWLIEQGLAREISGTVSLDFRPAGLVCNWEMKLL